MASKATKAKPKPRLRSPLSSVLALEERPRA